MNIIGNAADAIADTGTITIETESDEATYMIRISDIGPGHSRRVARTDLRTILHHEARRHRHGPRSCHRLQRRPGAQGDDPGRHGSRGRRALHDHDPEAASPMNPPGGPDPDRGTILVVDDEPDILVALEDLFEDDYRVLTATSPVRGPGDPRAASRTSRSSSPTSACRRCRATSSWPRPAASATPKRSC